MDRTADIILTSNWEIADEIARRVDSQKLASIQAITDFDLDSLDTDLATNIYHTLPRQLRLLAADWRAHSSRTQPGDSI